MGYPSSRLRTVVLAVHLAALAGCQPQSGPSASPPVLRFVFVRDKSARALATFSVEANDRLRPLYYTAFPGGLGTFEVHPNQRALITLGNSGEINAHALDPASGLLASRATLTVGDATDFAIDLTGTLLLAPDYNTNNVHLVNFNPATLALSLAVSVPWTSFRPTNVVMEPQGRWAYIYSTAEARIQAARIDRSPSVGITPVGSSVFAPLLKGAYVDPSGRFVYAVGLGPTPGISTIYVFQVNTDGSLTNTGLTTPLNQQGFRLRFWPGGRWVLAVGGGEGRALEMQANGALIERQFIGGPEPEDFVLESQRKLLFVFGRIGRDVQEFDEAFGIARSPAVFESIYSNVWSGDMIATATGANRVRWLPRRLVVAGFSDSRLVVNTIDPVSGALTFVANVPSGGVGPAALALHPTKPIVYVANATSDQIAAFALNEATGTPTQIGTSVTVGRFPGSLAVDGSGRFLYVCNRLANSVTILALNAADGALGASGIPDVMPGIAPIDALAADAEGRAIYVVSGRPPRVQRFAIVAQGIGVSGPGSITGNLVPSGPTITMNATFTSFNASIRNDGRGWHMYAVFPDQSGFYTINTYDGAAIQATGNLAHRSLVARAPDQLSLIAVGSTPASLERFDRWPIPIMPNGSGVVPISDPGISPLSAVIDPSSQWLFVSDGGNHKIFQFRLNGATGNPVEMSPVWGAPRYPTAMVITRVPF